MNKPDGVDVDPEATAAHAALFRALGDPARLAVLQHLTTGEHHVHELVDHLGLAQSTVSAHLACLRGCGLVTVRPDGRASAWSIAHPHLLAPLVAAAEALLDATGSRARLCRGLTHPAPTTTP